MVYRFLYFGEPFYFAVADSLADPQITPMATRTNTAIVVAAGQGQRMGSEVPKQFLDLNGAPLVLHALRAFAGAFEQVNLIVVLPEGWMHMHQVLQEGIGTQHTLHAVKGGPTRFASVKHGLDLLDEPSVVYVHDGARPLVSTSLIQKCREETLRTGSAIPVTPLKESLRLVEQSGSRAVDRSRYRLVQTPQTFYSEWLQEAFRQPYQDHFTDEASVVEHQGYPLNLIDGEDQNLKVTTPLDLILAQLLLNRHVHS